MKFKFGIVEIITIIIGIIYGLSLIPYYKAKSQYEDFIKDYPNSSTYGDKDNYAHTKKLDSYDKSDTIKQVLEKILTLFVFITVCHQAYINIVA
jgi:hypothetical protein